MRAVLLLLLAHVGACQALGVEVSVEDGLEHMPVRGVGDEVRGEGADPGPGPGHDALARARPGAVGLFDLVDAQDDAPGAACGPTALAVQALGSEKGFLYFLKKRSFL